MHGLALRARQFAGALGHHVAGDTNHRFDVMPDLVRLGSKIIAASRCISCNFDLDGHRVHGTLMAQHDLVVW